MMTEAEIQKAAFPGLPKALLGTVHLPSSRGRIIFRRHLGKLSEWISFQDTCVMLLLVWDTHANVLKVKVRAKKSFRLDRRPQSDCCLGQRKLK